MQSRIKIASSFDFNDKICAFVTLLNIKKVSVVQTNINYVKLRCFINWLISSSANITMT